MAKRCCMFAPVIDRPAMAERNQSLDLLRGMAILLVVLVHCAQAASGVVPGLSTFAEKYGEQPLPEKMSGSMGQYPLRTDLIWCY